MLGFLIAILSFISCDPYSFLFSCHLLINQIFHLTVHFSFMYIYYSFSAYLQVKNASLTYFS